MIGIKIVTKRNVESVFLGKQNLIFYRSMNKIAKTIALGAVLSSSAMAEGWEQSIDLGATVSKGNSDSILVSAGYTGTKKTESDEYGINALYTYGEEDSNATIHEFLGAGYVNRLYSERSYAGARLDVRSDGLAEIDYRVGLTAVAGHYFVKNEKTYFALEGGPGFTVDQVGGISDEYLSLYVGQKFEHKLDDKTRIFETFGITAPFDDLEDHSIVFELGLETFLSDSLALKVILQDKYEAEPAEGSDNNDFKLVTSISYKF